MEAVELRKKGEEPSKFPSKMLLNAEKHWSGCCYRISASQTHRALPGEPFPPTPKQTANISLHLPLCCAAAPTCPWQGSSMGGHSRWHLEEVNVFPSSVFSHLGSHTQPEMGAGRSSFSLVLHMEITRPLWRAPCWDRQKDRAFSLGVHSNQVHLLFPQQEALSSYHYNNECLQGYIASFIIIHP